MPVPSTKASDLSIDTLAHGQYKLADDAPPGGTLLAFYRGLHCPICKTFLKELDDRIGDFAIRGVRLLALSGDTQEHAAKLVDDMQIIRLPVGFGLSMQTARVDWDLFISTARDGTEEPKYFSEPGLFWVRADGTVAFSVVHSLPFMRPAADQILKAIDFALSKGFPPRGSYTGDLQ